MFRQERQHAVLGVPGRLLPLHIPPAPWVPGVFANQTWVSESRLIPSYGIGYRIKVELRFDDWCQNKHMSFSITGTINGPAGSGGGACGCIHEEIAAEFPELVPLLKWHNVATDGPMHYIANVVYMAGNQDCWGLAKGEKRQIRNGRTGQPCWSPVFEDSGEPAHHLPYLVDSDHCPPPPRIRYEPHWRVGEGKERELASARSIAVWPEATDEQLCLPKDELTVLLQKRLPKLLDDFRAQMESIGFLWEAPAEVTQ